MDFLSELNPQQQQAVMVGLGPVLVLAGPGSGKTRVLTHRIAYLIGSMGVRPYHILAVTFTNKAAREMEARVGAILGEAAHGLTLGTFHATCARILRREAEHLPFDSNFVIFDSDDQLSLVRRAIDDLNIDEKKFRAAGVHASISRAKNELLLPAGFPIQNYRDEVVKRIYQRYQELLLANNALDFDDLLFWMAILLEDKPDVREKYARRYEHVLVDEFQDTNMAQYVLLKHLASFHHNIFVVGDTDQCFPAGTSIQTFQGPRPVETICEGDYVLAASGHGECMPARVNHVCERAYEGELIRVMTRQGYSFSATPNHILFSRLSLDSSIHYVYLMHRKGLGYRIGIATGARSDGTSSELVIGLRIRSIQEGADQIWILRVCPSRDEAYFWESYYAFQYGIPMTVFHVRGRRMRISQEAIDRLYHSIDTDEHAKRLMADLNIDVRFPHFTPRAKMLRHVVNLRYFGDTRRSIKSPWNAHRVAIWSNNDELRRELEVRGYTVRKSHRQNWRIEFSRLHIFDAQALTEELSSIGNGLEVVASAFLTGAEEFANAPRFGLMPASHLHPSMVVAIEQDGKIIEDEVASVTRETYQGKIFDLEVHDLHNYIAGGIVVHNSIYRWRGADYRNVLRFEKDYPDTQVILLEQNYRSTQTILDAAMAVIDRNPYRTHKQLFTQRGEGQKIALYEAYDDRVEASFVVDTIAARVARRESRPGDFAVMYRTNAQSRVLEEAFLAAGLPYKLVGAQRFYGRREIKDVIAYLRLVRNPNDEVSLTRVINAPPRGIGDKTFLTLRTQAQKMALTPGQLILELGRGRGAETREALSSRASNSLTNFGSHLESWSILAAQNPPLSLMDKILEDVDYHAYIDDGTDEGHERWENVMELRRLAAEYSDQGLDSFLERVALVSDQDTVETSANVPTLLTLHAAKGLEYPVVFISGLDDGTFPHQRSFEDPEAMMEERRLFYVGITRAKDYLYLVYPLNRSTYGYAEPTIPSRFLEDIPYDLLSEETPSRSGSWGRRGPKGTSRRPDRWESTRPASARILQQRYPPGAKVLHPVWGEGMVLNSRIEDDDEIVDIFFENMGMKRVAASLAKLEVKRDG